MNPDTQNTDFDIKDLPIFDIIIYDIYKRKQTCKWFFEAVSSRKDLWNMFQK